MEVTAVTFHGTVVAFDGDAALIRGPSGAGKSDLALRLLALSRGALAAFGFPDLGRAALVADDRVVLTRDGVQVVAASPATLRGLLEVRGLGIIEGVTVVETAVVRLVVDLAKPGDVERMPPEAPTTDLLGVAVPHLKSAAFEASAALKIALALARVRASSAVRPPE